VREVRRKFLLIGALSCAYQQCPGTAALGRTPGGAGARGIGEFQILNSRILIYINIEPSALTQYAVSVFPAHPIYSTGTTIE